MNTNTSAIKKLHAWFAALPKSRIPMIVIVIMMIRIIWSPVDQYRRGWINLDRFYGDSVLYFSWVHSLVEDGDIQFKDDYQELDPTLTVNMQRPLPTGYTDNMFPPGAAILWSPFYLAAKAYAGIAGIEDRTEELNLLLMSANLGTAVAGAFFLLLIYLISRRFINRWLALLVAVTTYHATPFAHYIEYQRLFAHCAGAFAVSLFIWLLLRRKHDERSLGYWALLGVVFGLNVMIRLQTGIIAVWLVFEQLPVLIMAIRKRTRLPALLIRYGAFIGSALLSMVPLFLAFWTLYGIGGNPLDHGANTFWLDKPHIFEVLFSSRHGLISWHPVLLISIIGLGFLLRKETRETGIKAAVLFLAVLWVNASIGDWFAGASFGARRFIGFSALFALGFSGLLRQKSLVLKSIVIALMITGLFWNMALREQLDNSDYADATAEMVNPLNPDREVHVNTWGQPLISPWMDAAALPLGIPATHLDWILAYQLDRRQHNLGRTLLPETPSFQHGFSTPYRDDLGTFRRLDGTGVLYATIGDNNPPPYQLTIDGAFASDWLPEHLRPCLLIYVNDQPAAFVTAHRRRLLERWRYLFPQTERSQWRHGLNTITIRSAVIDADQQVFQPMLEDFFADPQTYSLRFNDGDYKLKIRRITFR